MLARWSLLATFLSAAVATTPFLEQSFFFDWNPAGQPLPIPVTPQCSTINIKWSRANARGPSPSAPYFLQIYTSTSLQPFIVDAGESLNYNFTVPFPVNTQYQICMFDKNGYTGGCQDIYTVTAPLTNTTTCTPINPLGPLSVDGSTADGPLNRYGSIDTCSDISVLPKNGTPPFTYTIAPSRHPPYNISSSYEAASLNWTVSLSWATSFFISVTDSAGNGWVQGPLHASEGKTYCLDTNIDKRLQWERGRSKGLAIITTIAAVCGGIGGILLGLLFGILGTMCCYKRARAQAQRARPILDEASILQKQSAPSIYTGSDFPVIAMGPPPSPSTYEPVSPDGMTTNTHFYNQSQIPRTPTRRSAYSGALESYVPTGSHRPGSAGNPSNIGPDPFQRGEMDTGAGPSNSDRIYIVHNDSGQAPVRVYTSSGADIVELPPQYTDTGSVAPGSDSTDTQRTPVRDRKSGSRRRPGSSASAHTTQTSFRPAVPLPMPPSLPGEGYVPDSKPSTATSYPFPSSST